jgi:glycine/D-amino acid oxidase-like deaminating enzyme
MSEATDRSTESDLAKSYRQESYWLDSIPESLEPLPALDGDITCDIVIVGAGFGGLWTAYHLKQAAPDIDIVILEAETAGYGASGRNGGAVSGYYYAFDKWVADPATREGAIAVKKDMIQAVYRIGEICEAEGIDCHYAREGCYMVATTATEEALIRERAEGFAELGFGPPDYELISAHDSQKHVAIEGVRSCVFSPHFAAIHPARRARGLARVLRGQGVRLFERSKVQTAAPGSVSTDRGSVRAQTVVLAAEAYIKSIKGFERLLAPIHGQMVATAPLGNEVFERTGITPPTRPYFSVMSPLALYGQLTADGRIVLGTGDTYYFGSRLRKGAEFKSQFAHRRLLDSFPKLRDVPITHRWGGAMGYARDSAPTVFLDEQKALAWIGGFSGSGLAPSLLMGATLADLITGQKSERTSYPWVRDGFPRHWEPEPLRWIGVSAVSGWLRLQDYFNR